MNEKRANKNKFFAGGTQSQHDWAGLLALLDLLATKALQLKNKQLYFDIKRKRNSASANKFSKKVYNSLLRDIEKYKQALSSQKTKEG